MDIVTTLPWREGLTIADLETMPGYGIKYELMDGTIYASGVQDRLTRRHLEAMPDDRRWRYELYDGVLVVSAAPSSRHQGVVGNLHLLLRAACPPALRVRLAPFDVTFSETTVLEPDLVVARAADLGGHDLRELPLLAIEVILPTSRRRDLGEKRDLYLEAGCPSYWVVDPGDARTPASLIAWNLVDGTYAEVGHATGDESWTSIQPFGVTLSPNALLDD